MDNYKKYIDKNIGLVVEVFNDKDMQIIKRTINNYKDENIKMLQFITVTKNDDSFTYKGSAFVRKDSKYLIETIDGYSNNQESGCMINNYFKDGKMVIERKRDDTGCIDSLRIDNNPSIVCFNGNDFYCYYNGEYYKTNQVIGMEEYKKLYYDYVVYMDWYKFFKDDLFKLDRILFRNKKTKFSMVGENKNKFIKSLRNVK